MDQLCYYHIWAIMDIINNVLLQIMLVLDSKQVTVEFSQGTFFPSYGSIVFVVVVVVFSSTL